MFPVFVAATPSKAELTTDATSPIHDAVRDAVLYDPIGHGSRLPLRRIVQNIVNEDDWPFVCPFCRHYREENGHDAYGARKVWEQAGQPDINDDFLINSPELAAALPLFADPDRRARPTYVAHNHWVVSELCREVPVDAARVPWAIERIRALKENAFVTTGRGLRASTTILGLLNAREND